MKSKALFLLSIICVSPVRQIDALSFFSGRRRRMEDTVRRYIQGVNDRDPRAIRSCFEDAVVVRDVCGGGSYSTEDNAPRLVAAHFLVEQSKEFWIRNPDTVIGFHYGPECGRTSDWVISHWFATTRQAAAEAAAAAANNGIALSSSRRYYYDNDQYYDRYNNNNNYDYYNDNYNINGRDDNHLTLGSSRHHLLLHQLPVSEEGQTRYRVNPKTFKIQEFVVTRTINNGVDRGSLLNPYLSEQPMRTYNGMERLPYYTGMERDPWLHPYPEPVRPVQYQER